MKIDVKDRVKLKNTNQKGTIMVRLSKGKYKILWDRDWNTGRVHTHIYRELEIIKLQNHAN